MRSTKRPRRPVHRYKSLLFPGIAVLAIFAFGTYSHFSAIRGSSHGAGWAGQTFCDGAVRWSEKSVSWSGTSTAAGLCNESGKLYSLIALLDASK